MFSCMKCSISQENVPQNMQQEKIPIANNQQWSKKALHFIVSHNLNDIALTFSIKVKYAVIFKKNA